MTPIAIHFFLVAVWKFVVPVVGSDSRINNRPKPEDPVYEDANSQEKQDQAHPGAYPELGSIALVGVKPSPRA